MIIGEGMVRWDVLYGSPVRFVSKPHFYFEGYPPLAGESTSEYLTRVIALGIFDFPGNAQPILYRRKWWQLWRPKR